MMKAIRWYIPAILLLSLLLSGCSRNKNSDNAQLLDANTAGTLDTGTNPDGEGVVTTSGDRTAAKDRTTSVKPHPAQVVIAAGTPITVRLQQSLSSGYSTPGQHFEAVLNEPIVIGDRTVLPVGTPVIGHVVSARRSGRLRHPGAISVTLDTVTLGNRQIPVATSSVAAYGGSHKKRNLAWIGGGTGGGALIGALAGGGTGALIGSGIGAAAGTTTAFATGKKEAGFPAERVLRFRLNRDVTLAG